MGTYFLCDMKKNLPKILFVFAGAVVQYRKSERNAKYSALLEFVGTTPCFWVLNSDSLILGEFCAYQ